MGALHLLRAQCEQDDETPNEAHHRDRVNLLHQGRRQCEERRTEHNREDGWARRCCGQRRQRGHAGAHLQQECATLQHVRDEEGVLHEGV